jgi:hypothetical protein
MGRRNTSSKSTCKGLNSWKSFASVDSNGTPPWLGLIEYNRTERFLLGEVLSDQLIMWCCIDRLSSHGLPEKWNNQLFDESLL